MGDPVPGYFRYWGKVKKVPGGVVAARFGPRVCGERLSD